MASDAFCCGANNDCLLKRAYGYRTLPDKSHPGKRVVFKSKTGIDQEENEFFNISFGFPV
jgi:hypothetical protein